MKIKQKFNCLFNLANVYAKTFPLNFFLKI